MKHQRWYIKIRDKFWFIPGCYAVLSLIIVIGASIMDQQVLRPIYNNVPAMLLVTDNTATSMYSALVTALLTLTTISFSSIMVVLTTYSTQFTPRALQDFMKSPTTQHTLGFYIRRSVYSREHAAFFERRQQPDSYADAYRPGCTMLSGFFYCLYIPLHPVAAGQSSNQPYPLRCFQSYRRDVHV